ncbi:HAD-IIA family hydrolase [Geodermatophilus sp. YIM 151500]|uniref:HAD-IIA family hydrolase n=1 Tax=Geodermatophilus sp. YIM 151500 TaxID=2984531 RepID=UPI0021E50B49|nr:HAD-IIA family hydrolase [Geodermatophilus sp. YIM 151500]MCV2489001.1 HAD-IIA family hydrolase [Geodermatophilus sp. YIM 151500]
MNGATDPPPLAAGCAEPPARAFDVALLDLDGVVYVGPEAVPGVPDALARARTAGLRLGFVTNNASRTPERVAALLTGLGVDAGPGDVITSAQSAATVVRERWGAGAAVLPVGGPGVAAALRAAGLRVVAGADDGPVAVVQGFGPDVGWQQLAEAVVAVRAGARHVATNADVTVPSPRGPVPGNGALVAVVQAVTGVPPLVTGKPDPAMHAECVRRTGARRPLVVGDRLDTDIEGAHRAGVPSLLVLSGITGAAALLEAEPAQRPHLVAPDAAGLLAVHPPVVSDGGAWRCGGWTVRPGEAGALQLSLRERGGFPDGGSGDGLDGLRALCVARWSRPAASGGPARIVATDAPARRALDRWGMAPG